MLPDETVSNKGRTIKLGGTRLELKYVGLNHSDSTLIMRLPKQKIIFVVDLIPVGQVPGRGMIDFYPIEAEASMQKIIAMQWETMIPGHPGAGGRLGTKQDAKDQLAFFQDASREVQKAAREGKCWDGVEKGAEAAEVRRVGWLRKQPAVRAAPLLWALGSGHLRRAPDGP